MGKDYTEKLKKYIKEERPGRFKSFIRKHGIDVCELQLDKGQNLLHYCCKCGQDIIFRYLLKKGVNFKQQDNKGDTPLHLSLKCALKSTSNEVYTSIILPLIQKSPELLEIINQDGISCRRLLDKLVEKRQSHHEDHKAFYHPGSDETEESWEDKLTEELRNEYDDFTGRYQNEEYDHCDSETHDEWADRLRREYHMKHKYGGSSHGNKRETTQSSHKKDKQESKENLEDIRKKMRQKYEENQKKDRENRILLKSKNYMKNITAFHTSDGEIKFNDLPWPYHSDIAEIKSVMFHEVISDSDLYKKRLREEQIRWHPDKFLQKHGKKINEKDRERIMQRVKEISQELNRLSDLFQ